MKRPDTGKTEHRRNKGGRNFSGRFRRGLCLFAGILVLMGLCLCPAACGKAPGQGAETGEDSGKLRIVSTIFPLWDWTREILGDNPGGMGNELLLSSGVDLHSYQPSVDDVLTITECDLFIYVGGESDAWVKDVLAGAENPSLHTLCLMDILGSGAREETAEGLAAGDEDHPAADGEEDAQIYDEHVWLSLKNAEIFCRAIGESLSVLDTEHAGIYKENALEYCSRLEELDRACRDAVDAGTRRVLLFADRFPFLYMMKDYDLEYFAAFAGCSSETAASFETIAFLAGKADELSLPCVLVTETSDESLARTVIQSTKAGGQKILVLDSLQSVTRDKIDGGMTYISVMEKNIGVLAEALS